MKNSLARKIKVLLKARQIFQNWTLYLRVYLKIVTDEHVIFQTKNGLKIKIRSNSTDLMALTNVWLYEEYACQNRRNLDLLVQHPVLGTVRATGGRSSR